MNQLNPPKEADVYKDNTQTRTPVMIVIDASATMQPYQEDVRQAIPVMMDNLIMDSSAAWRIEIGIMAFNKTPQLLLPIKESFLHKPADYRNLPFTCRGRTHIGEAVNDAIDWLFLRVAKLQAEGIHSNPPCLILITDGHANYSDAIVDKGRDEWARAYQRVRELTWEDKLHVIAVGMGQYCDHFMLNALIEKNPKNQKLNLDDLSNIRNVFPVISSILSSVARGTAPVPPPITSDPPPPKSEPKPPKHKPVSRKPKPVPQKPEPVPQKPEPVPQKSEPVPQKPEPVPQKPEPVPQKPEPVPQKPEPVPQKPEPVSQKSELISQKFEPISQKLEPVPQKPEPVQQKSELISQKFEPKPSQPQPKPPKTLDSTPIPDIPQDLKDKLDDFDDFHNKKKGF